MFKTVELLRPLSDDWSSEPALQLHQRGEQACRWHDGIGAVAEELHLHWSRSQHCQLQLQTRLEILQDTMVGLHQDGCALGERVSRPAGHWHIYKILQNIFLGYYYMRCS